MRPTLPIVVVVLVAYGSLFPFHFVAPTDVQRALEMLLADRRLWTSLSDVLGNIALFVPLGATGVWWGATRTSRGYAALWTVLAGLAFAFLLQVGQIFVPERSAAMADVFWNAVGTVIGAAIALIIEVSGLTSSR